MSDFVVIRPQDGAAAQQASDWCDELVNLLQGRGKNGGHNLVEDVNASTPADKTAIRSAITKPNDLVFYFGHGTSNAWTVNKKDVIDRHSISCVSGKAVVSIACKTGQQMGSDAITAGALFWFGFTIKVPVILPYKNVDPIGEAIYEALAGFGSSKSAHQVHSELVRRLDQVVSDYDTGRFSNHPDASMGYFFAMALRDHIVVHGQPNYTPM